MRKIFDAIFVTICVIVCGVILYAHKEPLSVMIAFGCFVICLIIEFVVKYYYKD